MSEEKKEAAKKPVKKAAPKVECYSSICKGKFVIGSVEIVDGFKLVKELKDNEAFMKRFNHALKIGVVKKD